MGASFSEIGHGLTEKIAIESALGYIALHRYVVKRRAESISDGETMRLFFFIEGLNWHECVLQKTNRHLSGAPAAFIASFLYFAATDEDLKKKMNGDVIITSVYKK